MKQTTRGTPIRALTVSALTAAIYVILTELSAFLGLSGNVIQCRLSEALCVLPAFTPAAIPGLFVGCLLSNLLTGALPFDILFGSLATLAGAAGCYLLRKAPYPLYPLPTVLANSIAIPLVLTFTYEIGLAYPLVLLSVAIGEILSAGVLGILLYRILRKYRKYLRL